MHTVGPKTFAIIREELKNEHPDKESPSLANMFERTRRRNEGKKYQESSEDIAKMIDNMNNYIAPHDGNASTDACAGVTGNEFAGNCKLYGRGVCNKKLKKLNGMSSYVVPGEIMESLKASMFEEMKKDVDCQISKIDEMRKELEEDHSRKKAELENMQTNIDNERNTMTDQVMRKILEKIPQDVVRQYLS